MGSKPGTANTTSDRRDTANSGNHNAVLAIKMNASSS